MKKQGWLILLVLGLTICLAGVPARAQEGKSGVFVGYSYGTNNFYNYDPGINGYAFSYWYNFNKHIGLEGSFSGHNGTDQIYYVAATADDDGYNENLRQDLYTYTFGPRISMPIGHFTVFTHFLVGANHIHEGYTETCTNATGEEEETCGSYWPENSGSKGYGFAFKTGAGVDYNHGLWGIRILEVDYVHGEAYSKENYSEGVPSDILYSETYTYWGSSNDFELATGVTFTFGKKKY